MAGQQGEPGEIIFTEPRILEPGLDRIAFPARDLFPNDRYIDLLEEKIRKCYNHRLYNQGLPLYL